MEHQNDIIKAINDLIRCSRFYFYDKEYDRHIKNMKKLRKLIERGETEKYMKRSDSDDE